MKPHAQMQGMLRSAINCMGPINHFQCRVSLPLRPVLRILTFTKRASSLGMAIKITLPVSHWPMPLPISFPHRPVFLFVSVPYRTMLHISSITYRSMLCISVIAHLTMSFRASIAYGCMELPVSTMYQILPLSGSVTYKALSWFVYRRKWCYWRRGRHCWRPGV